MDNVAGFQDSALVVFGGLVAEANPEDNPAGSAPVCCDIDFTVASAITREGVVNVYTFDGFDQLEDAGLGVNIAVEDGVAWDSPDNIIHNTPGTYASVTLNAVPVAVSANNQQLVFHANGQSIPLTEIQDNAGNPGVWATLFGTFSQEQVIAATSIVVTGFVNGANNGTFTVLGVATGQITIVCTCVNETHAATGVTNTGNGPSWTLTVTASGSAIEVGDTGFVQINGRDPFSTPSPLTTIASVTDNLGNTWAPVAPVQYTEDPVRGLFQMWYAVMGTAVALGDQFIITVNEDNSGNPVGMTALAFQNFRGVGALIGFVQNAGLDSETWGSGTLDPPEAAFLLSYAWSHESISTGPTGFTAPPPDVWGSNGANNSQGYFSVGGPGTVTDTGWAQEAPDAFASTLAAFTVATAPTGSFSDILQASDYGFTAPDSSQILGIELFVNGKQSRPSTVLTIEPIGGGEITTFALTSTDGTFSTGGVGSFFGLDPTPASVNNSGFGFELSASDLSGMGATVDISGIEIELWYTPPGLTQFDWIGTYIQQDGTILTLALDNTGVFWQEEVLTDEGVLTPFYTAIEPNTFADGVTEDNREFIALSDLINATDMPRTYDGIEVDRLSQVGPAAAPSISFQSQLFPIISITQPAPVTNTAAGNPIRALNWSTGPGVKYQSGNIITIEYTLATSPPDPNIYAGGGVVLSGFIDAPNGGDPNGFYIVQSVQTTNTGNGLRNSFSVAAPTSASTYDDPPSGASYQSTLATLTTSEPVPNLQVGGSLTVSGASEAEWDNTWTVLYTPNAAQLEITDTQLVSNVAIYAYSLISGTAPVVGEQVTVTGATNGGQANGESIFNVVNAIISAVGGDTFSVQIDAPNVSAQAEDGSAIINGTIFQFDPGPSAVGATPSTPTFDPIIGDSTGGELTQAGNLGAGTRGCVVMFLTRNGLLTKPSPEAIFTLPESANSITVSSILVGPPNIVARVLAFTGAGGATIDGGGGFYFWIPTPVSVLDNGQTVVYSATIIPDNITTTVQLTFTDAVLLSADAISIQGSNNFAQIELGSCTGLISYANRIFAIGEQNKVLNFNNWSFDGGYLQINPNTPIQPAGWTVDPVNGAGGQLVDSPLFGNAYQIANTTGGAAAILGMIEQTAYQDPNKVAIILPRTQYNIRVTAATTATSGDLVIDLYSPTFAAAFGTFTLPLADLTDTMSITTGFLLTNEFTVSVPNDLLLRIYATNLPNGTSVTIDRIEPYDASLPILNTQMRASYYNNFEAFDSVTGNLGVGSQNQQPIFCAFELFDNLYIVKNKSLVSTVDNGVTEPSQWSIRDVSDKCGTQSINGVDVGEGWALIAGQPGVYLFEGGQPVKISPEIDPVWKAINWAYGYTLWIRNDTNERKFYIGVPIATPNQWMPNFPANPAPTVPNVVLMCNYKELMTSGALASEGPLRVAYTGELKSFPLGRKWSAWSIEACYADFIKRADTTEPIFFLPDTGVGKVYQQLADYYMDDGEGMHCKYVTYPFPKTSEAQASPMGLHELETHLMTLLIRGEGNFLPVIYPDTLDSPNADALLPVELGDPPPWGDTEVPLNEVGNRFFVDLSPQDPGDWFEVSRIVMTLSKNPWAEVRGSN
jgi:hypothetical protein